MPASKPASASTSSTHSGSAKVRNITFSAVVNFHLFSIFCYWTPLSLSLPLPDLMPKDPRLLRALLLPSPSSFPPRVSRASTARNACTEWQARLATAQTAIRQQQTVYADLLREKHRLLLDQRLSLAENHGASSHPKPYQQTRGKADQTNVALPIIHAKCSAARDVLACFLGQASRLTSQCAAKLISQQMRRRQLESSQSFLTSFEQLN